MEVIFTICYIITFVGAVNWGLVGLAKFDLVAAITGNKFGEISSSSRSIYSLVLIAGIIAAFHYFS